MIQYISNIFLSESLSPHGICLLWRPELIWTHAISDAIIGLAYFSIPVVLSLFAAKRPDFGFGWVLWCFVAFILACGTTHFMSLWTLWVPDYGLEALVKVVTAIASVMTAALLWPLLPRVVALPSASQLTVVNDALTRRIAERDAALEALRGEQLQRSKTEAMLLQAQKMEVFGQIAGGVAHDFNNLLTVILMNLRRYERLSMESSDVEIRSIKNALLAAERGATLTGQLLSFARKQPLQAMDMDLGQTIASLVPILNGVIQDRAELRLELPDQEVLAHVDRTQLEMAVINLVANARDAISIAGKITIEVQEAFDSVVVSVLDNGRGMPNEVRERAVEPFFTTKDVGKGSGLGLSQVLGFVEQSGGKLSIASSEGKGTIVSLTFPKAGPNR